MEDIIKKQQLLMDTVPHPLTPEASCMSQQAIDTIGMIILLINSYGRKPWRPNPLPQEVRDSYKFEVKVAVAELNKLIKDGAQFYPGEEANRKMVSTLGIIEEAVECHNEISAEKPNKAKILEEYVDILFFWAELGIENGFTWQQIKDEYNRKWAVNMQRYADAKKGDYAWDDRKDKNSL